MNFTNTEGDKGKKRKANNDTPTPASRQEVAGSATNPLNPPPRTGLFSWFGGNKRKQTEPKPTSVLLKNPEEGKCSFCFIDLGIGDGIMLQECLHVFCKQCLQAAIEMQKDLPKVPCPFAGGECGASLNDAEVKELVSAEMYQEYIDRSLAIARKKMKNVFNCRTDNCSGWCEFDPGRKTFDCPLCRHTNCLQCEAIHTGINCEEYVRLISSGQHSTLKELMEKEENSGWSQLMESFNASGDAGLGGSVLDGMIQKELLLNTKKFECPVCFTEVDEGDGVILQDCLHLCCKACLIHHVDHNDEDAIVKCPYIDANYSCTGYLQACEIKALVPNEIYEKHLLRSVKLGESGMENSFHCKTPDCPGWCEYGKGAKLFVCPICKKHNCILCEAIHTGSCEDYKNSLVQNKNDLLSEKAVEDLIKNGKCMRCPKCKIVVQKTAGCDWVMCTKCRTEICWATKGPRWGPKGRGDTSGGCKCRLTYGKKCHPKCRNCH